MDRSASHKKHSGCYAKQRLRWKPWKTVPKSPREKLVAQTKIVVTYKGREYI